MSPPRKAARRPPLYLEACVNLPRSMTFVKHDGEDDHSPPFRSASASASGFDESFPGGIDGTLCALRRLGSVQIRHYQRRGARAIITLFWSRNPEFLASAYPRAGIHPRGAPSNIGPMPPPTCRSRIIAFCLAQDGARPRHGTRVVQGRERGYRLRSRQDSRGGPAARPGLRGFDGREARMVGLEARQDSP